MPITPNLSTPASEFTTVVARSPATFVETDRGREHPRSFLANLRTFLFGLVDRSAFQDVSLGREISVVFTSNGPLVYRRQTNNDVRNEPARSLRN